MTFHQPPKSRRALFCVVSLGFFCVLPACATSCSPSPRAAPDVSQRLVELRAVNNDRNMTGGPRSQAIVEAYLRLFPSPADAELEHASTDDLRNRITAALIVSGHQLHDPVSNEGLRLLHALERRGQLTETDASRLHRIFIDERRFSEASQLQRRFPTLEAIPHLERQPIQATRTVWRVTPERALSQMDAPALEGAQLLVIGDPRCHFTVRAAEAIDDDADMGPLFEDSIWLVPPGPSLNMNAITEWEAQFPWAPLSLANQRAEWPQVDDWATPNFYFLRDGVVEATVVGWPKEGRKTELMEAAAKVGLRSNRLQP